MAKISWQASRIEQRTAWSVAIVAIIIIVVAASQPQWFDFTSVTQLSESISKQAVLKQAVAKQSIHKQAPPKQAINKASPTPVVKAKPAIHTKPVPAKTPPKAQPSIKSKALSKPPTSSIRKGFYVQLGAFKEYERAQRLNNQLKKKGWSVHVTSRRTGLFAVWIGPKATRDKAEKLLKTIQLKLKYKGFIVHHKS